MYTIAPIPPVDTLHDHTGLFFFVVLGGIMWCVVIGNTDYTENKTGKRIALASMLVFPMTIAFYLSFYTGEYTVYKNERVNAELVGFVAESYMTREVSGKISKDVDHHNSYVQYKVENNYVFFPASPELSYPTYAVLYKN